MVFKNGVILKAEGYGTQDEQKPSITTNVWPFLFCLDFKSLHETLIVKERGEIPSTS